MRGSSSEVDIRVPSILLQTYTYSGHYNWYASAEWNWMICWIGLRGVQHLNLGLKEAELALRTKYGSGTPYVLGAGPYKTIPALTQTIPILTAPTPLDLLTHNSYTRP